jgi:hypothetical protein
MDLDDLIRELAPPPNRVGNCAGDREHHLDGGAVMVAFAMHLLRTRSTLTVCKARSLNKSVSADSAASGFG